MGNFICLGLHVHFTTRLKHIFSSTPFSDVLKDSLYTTVWIEKREKKYKAVRIVDYDAGNKSTKKKERIGIEIPYIEITCSVRYCFIEEYRDSISETILLNNSHPELLSDLAKRIILAKKEEDDFEDLVRYINSVTGTISLINDYTVETSTQPKIIKISESKLSLSLNQELCKELKLNEISRRTLYQIRYFTYDDMEELNDI